jgi:uncharacterized protein (TIGR02246 family)
MASNTAGAAVASEFTAMLAVAWNRHDMTAFASLFHDDAAFVNVAGTCMRGREEIERVHAAAHAGPFRSSTLSAKLQDARDLGPGVVLAHVSTELRGDDRAPGQVRGTLMTLVIERRDTNWEITAVHNTNVAPPA